MVTYSYTCLPYDTPYEKAAVPTNDFFQLVRIVFSKVNILAIVIQDFRNRQSESENSFYSYKDYY